MRKKEKELRREEIPSGPENKWQGKLLFPVGLGSFFWMGCKLEMLIFLSCLWNKVIKICYNWCCHKEVVHLSFSPEPAFLTVTPNLNTFGNLKSKDFSNQVLVSSCLKSSSLSFSLYSWVSARRKAGCMFSV